MNLRDLKVSFCLPGRFLVCPTTFLLVLMLLWFQINLTDQNTEYKFLFKQDNAIAHLYWSKGLNVLGFLYLKVLLEYLIKLLIYKPSEKFVVVCPIAVNAMQVMKYKWAKDEHFFVGVYLSQEKWSIQIISWFVHYLQNKRYKAKELKIFGIRRTAYAHAKRGLLALWFFQFFIMACHYYEILLKLRKISGAVWHWEREVCLEKLFHRSLDPSHTYFSVKKCKI